GAPFPPRAEHGEGDREAVEGETPAAGEPVNNPASPPPTLRATSPFAMRTGRKRSFRPRAAWGGVGEADGGGGADLPTLLRPGSALRPSSGPAATPGRGDPERRAPRRGARGCRAGSAMRFVGRRERSGRDGHAPPRRPREVDGAGHD